MKHAFETKRLRVFRCEDITPMDANTPRTVFMAFRRDIDRPMVAATAVIWMDAVRICGGPYVDWLEVSSEYRRQGLGTELLRGIETHLDSELYYEGGSELGDLFCAALDVE